MNEEAVGVGSVLEKRREIWREGKCEVKKDPCDERERTIK